MTLTLMLLTTMNSLWWHWICSVQDYGHKIRVLHTHIYLIYHRLHIYKTRGLGSFHSLFIFLDKRKVLSGFNTVTRFSNDYNHICFKFDMHIMRSQFPTHCRWSRSSNRCRLRSCARCPSPARPSSYPTSPHSSPPSRSEAHNSSRRKHG